MSILYRRFMLVAAMIAAFGVLTANLIQETRRDATYRPVLSPGLPLMLKYSCEGEKSCAMAGPETTLIG